VSPATPVWLMGRSYWPAAGRLWQL
jgi:hypothetical protein